MWNLAVVVSLPSSTHCTWPGLPVQTRRSKLPTFAAGFAIAGQEQQGSYASRRALLRGPMGMRPLGASRIFQTRYAHRTRPWEPFVVSVCRQRWKTVC